MARIKTTGRDRIETIMLMLADIRRDVKKLKRRAKPSGRKRVDWDNAVTLVIDFINGRVAMNGKHPYVSELKAYMTQQGYSGSATKRAMVMAGCETYATSLSRQERVRLLNDALAKSVPLSDL